MKFPRAKRFFSKRFTFMLVPHNGSGTPVQFNIPLSFIVMFLAVWTGITFWGSYLSAQHVDYWRSQVSNKVLQLKVRYLVNQLDKSRGFMDEVKQIEANLRNLLKYKSKSEIITNDSVVTASAGGPSFADTNEVSQLLNNQGPDLSWQRIVEKVTSFQKEAMARLDSYNDVTAWIDKQRNIYRSTPRGWPSPGRLSSHFGMRTDPFSKKQEYHYGIDITAPIGTPVRATADGVVKMANWHSGYGKLVVLDHEFGYSTRFAHNGRLLVRVGDKVKRGQAIALMGNTGKSSGPHCHYEVWRYQKRVNPYAYLKGDYPKIESEGKVSSATKSSADKS